MKKVWTFLVIVFIIGSCKTNSNQTGVIEELRITLPLAPNCATIAFRIETNDASFKEIIKNVAHYTVEINGAFFNYSAFYMGKPEINFYEDNTCLITSGSCYFIDRDQSELNLIANSALKEVSVVVTCNDKKWVFKSKK